MIKRLINEFNSFISECEQDIKEKNKEYAIKSSLGVFNTKIPNEEERVAALKELVERMKIQLAENHKELIQKQVVVENAYDDIKLLAMTFKL